MFHNFCFGFLCFFVVYWVFVFGCVLFVSIACFADSSSDPAAKVLGLADHYGAGCFGRCEPGFH